MAEQLGGFPKPQEQSKVEKPKDIIKEEYEKMVKKISYIEDNQQKTRYELTDYGRESLDEFEKSLNLDQEFTPYGLGSGEYTNINKVREKSIEFINGLPYKIIRVLRFTYEGDQGGEGYYSKAFFEGIGHNFSGAIDEPTIIRESSYRSVAKY